MPKWGEKSQGQMSDNKEIEGGPDEGAETHPHAHKGVRKENRGSEEDPMIDAVWNAVSNE